MKKLRYIITSSVLALLVLLPGSLMAAPIVVRINDVPNAAPVVTVIGAPNGYDLYTGPGIATPGIEEGGIITLFGVDQFGSVGQDEFGFDLGWRFVVPNAPDPARAAVDIVFIQHDFDIFGNGDLQVGFDSALPGIYYRTPPDPHIPGRDFNAGLVTDGWVTLYSDDTLVVQFKPHTYRLRN